MTYNHFYRLPVFTCSDFQEIDPVGQPTDVYRFTMTCWDQSQVFPKNYLPERIVQLNLGGIAACHTDVDDQVAYGGVRINRYNRRFIYQLVNRDKRCVNC